MDGRSTQDRPSMTVHASRASRSADRRGVAKLPYEHETWGHPVQYNLKGHQLARLPQHCGAGYPGRKGQDRGEPGDCSLAEMS